MTSVSSMDEQFIEKLTQVIDENLHNEEFGASELATQLGISRVTLYRKVKSIVKKSVNEFIREARIKRAYELLINKSGTVSEISYEVGFTNPGYFNKCFRDFFGVTPGEVLKGNKKVSKNKPHKNRLSKKQLLYYSIGLFLVVLALVLVFFLPATSDHDTSKEKTIAVLLFDTENLRENQLEFVVSFREEIKNRLKNSKNLDLVVNRISEKNKFSELNSQRKKRKLNANFVLHANTISRTDSTLTIYFYLMDLRSGKILPIIHSCEIDLSKEYEHYNSILNIADAIDLAITEKKDKNFKNEYTSNKTALRMYTLGKNQEENWAYEKRINWENGLDELKNAQSYYLKALTYDSNYVCPMIALGNSYLWSRTRFRDGLPVEMSSRQIYDTILHLTNKAIGINPEYVNSYVLRAWVVNWVDNTKAINLLRNAIEIDPGHGGSYFCMFNILGWAGGISGIEMAHYLFKGYLLSKEEFIDSQMLSTLHMGLMGPGFIEESQEIRNKLLEDNQDTLGYCILMQEAELLRPSYKKVIEYGEKALAMNPEKLEVYNNCGKACIFKGNYKQAKSWYTKYLVILREQLGAKDASEYNLAYNHHGRNANFGYNARFPILNAAYAFQMNGMEEEAANLYKGRLDNLLSQTGPDFYDKTKKLNLISKVNALEFLLIYSALNQKEKALEMVEICQLKGVNFGLNKLKLPLFDNIRTEPKFKAWEKELETKHLKSKIEKQDLLESLGLFQFGL